MEIITDRRLPQKDFAKILARKNKISEEGAESIVRMFLSTLIDVLKDGNGIKFLGHITMDIAQVNERTYSNKIIKAKSGKDEVTKPAHKKVVFEAGKILHDAVN